MNDYAPRPKGIVCKCGSAKSETEYFCAACTPKLPAHLLENFRRCRSHPFFRELTHRAIVILGLPVTRHQKKRKYYA